MHKKRTAANTCSMYQCCHTRHRSWPFSKWRTMRSNTFLAFPLSSSESWDDSMTCCKSANVELPHFDVEKEFDCFTLRFTLFDAESSTLKRASFFPSGKTISHLKHDQNRPSGYAKTRPAS